MTRIFEIQMATRFIEVKVTIISIILDEVKTGTHNVIIKDVEVITTLTTEAVEVEVVDSATATAMEMDTVMGMAIITMGTITATMAEEVSIILVVVIVTMALGMETAVTITGEVETQEIQRILLTGKHLLHEMTDSKKNFFRRNMYLESTLTSTKTFQLK